MGVLERTTVVAGSENSREREKAKSERLLLVNTMLDIDAYNGILSNTHTHTHLDPFTEGGTLFLSVKKNTGGQH